MDFDSPTQPELAPAVIYYTRNDVSNDSYYFIQCLQFDGHFGPPSSIL